MTRRYVENIADHSYHFLGTLERDIDRDYFIAAHEVCDYGLNDEILDPKGGFARVAVDMIAKSVESLRRSSWWQLSDKRAMILSS